MTKEEAESMLVRYTTRPNVVETRPHTWNTLDVEVLLDGKRIGSYRRNYSQMYDTFVPFVQDDGNGGYRILALYSPDYTGTRLMRLPECIDIGGEEPFSYGFCPTGYYVPYLPEKGLTGQFGFVAGCRWGEDDTWKIQYLDLGEATGGILRRDDRFGYLEIPTTMPLRDAVSVASYRLGDYGFIKFHVVLTYSLKQNRFPDPFE